MEGCDCPLPDALTTIPGFSCGEDMGQIQKLIFQRRQATPPLTVTEAALLTNWQDLLDATDDTKVVITPFISGFAIPKAEPNLEGGNDNSTINGAPIPHPSNPVRSTGDMRSVPAATLRAMKDLNCEDPNGMTVYMVNQFGKIFGVSTDGTDFEGFGIQAPFVGDSSNEGYAKNDLTPINMSYPTGWRDYLKSITPSDFNALTDLAATGS